MSIFATDNLNPQPLIACVGTYALDVIVVDIHNHFYMDASNFIIDKEFH